MVEAKFIFHMAVWNIDNIYLISTTASVKLEIESSLWFL